MDERSVVPAEEATEEPAKLIGVAVRENNVR